MNKGFTLVELSIVLVIIGLLTGGILVAQSLIETARITRFVSEYNQYKIMVDHFEDRYKGLPGDTSLFPVSNRGTATADDGLLRDEVSSDSTFTGEIGHFWKHLSQAKMIPDDFTEVATSGVVPGTNLPEMVFENAIPYVDTFSDTDRSAQYFIVFDPSGSDDESITGHVTPVFTTPQALAIDTKIDDGIALLNNQCSAPNFICKEVMFSDGSNSCHDGVAFPIGYNVSNEDARCLSFFRFK